MVTYWYEEQDRVPLFAMLLIGWGATELLTTLIVFTWYWELFVVYWLIIFCFALLKIIFVLAISFVVLGVGKNLARLNIGYLYCIFTLTYCLLGIIFVLPAPVYHWDLYDAIIFLYEVFCFIIPIVGILTFFLFRNLKDRYITFGCVFMLTIILSPIGLILAGSALLRREYGTVGIFGPPRVAWW